MPYFGKSEKNFFLLEKNPTSSSKIGGFGGKKMFRKSFETSLIISSEIIKFARKIVLCKSFSIGKKSNFNFQNRGYFEKKNRNPHR